jgi:glycosyltransferase involved in cell wall biosynthesis
VAYVATIHDLDAILYPHLYTQRYSLYYARTVASAIRRAHIVLTDTEAVRSMILERYALAEDRVQVVGIGVNPHFAEAVRRLGAVTRTGPPTLLYVGRLEAKKNVEWLIETVARGVRTGALPRLRLLLAGGSSYGIAAIQRALREAGEVAEWVVAPGVEQLAALYVQSDFLVLPSHCEGFGIPLIEAMFCGKPIVASRIPTSVEVAGDAAYFFDLDDVDGFYAAVNECVDGKARPTRDAVAAQRLAHYAWPVLAQTAANVYAEARRLV